MDYGIVLKFISALSSPDKVCPLASINHWTRLMFTSRRHLILVILGTAWVYRSPQSRGGSGNCHKVPQKEFKELLPHTVYRNVLPRMIKSTTRSTLRQFLVSPVSPVMTHQRWLVQNQRQVAFNKCTLAIEFETAAYSYFPSYEIMMDELRDYRFIKKICCNQIK
jgi:hypothetical protein